MISAKLRQKREASERIGRLAAWIGARLDSFVLRPSERRSFSRFLSHPFQSPLLYTLLLEVRNFFGRIEMSFGKSLWARGVDLGPASEVLSCGCLVPNARTDFHTLCTRKLEGAFPWATLVDSQILLQTLDTVADKIVRTVPFCTSHHTQLVPRSTSTDCALNSPIPSILKSFRSPPLPSQESPSK